MITHRTAAVPALLVVSAALLPVSADAQEPWPFVSFEVHRYESLINTDEDVGLPCCFPHVVGNPGEALIHLSAVVDVPWSEELDRVSVSARDLTLTVPGEEEPRTQIGSYDAVGLFEAGTSSVSASRPRDWPEEDEHLKMETVWSLPADATTATLTFGEFFTTEVTIPQSPSEPLTPGDTADFAITAITPLDGLETLHTFSGQPLAGTVDPAAGQLLQVDFLVTPLMDTSLGRRPGFVLYTRYMQLVGPNGLPAVPVGQFLGDGLTTDTSNSISGNAFVGASFDYSFLYLTDGTPGTYTLYFMSDPVAEGTL